MNTKKRIEYILSHVKKIGFLETGRYFIQRLLKSKGSLITMNIPNVPYPIYLRNKTYDTHIFYQIFIQEDLALDYGEGASTILDCGANIGLSTIFYKRKFPKARIISVEPEKSNYELLLKNTKNYVNIVSLKNGVSGSDCELSVIDIGEGEASYRILENEKKGKMLETIHCKSINTIIEEFEIQQIDILKMDIEGSEKQCLFEGDVKWLQKTKWFLLEIHENIYPGLKKEILTIIPSSSTISTKGEYTVIQNRN